jgi:fido (protein-threonine AMPylation protein)
MNEADDHSGVQRRHSLPEDSERVDDPLERAKREAENGLRQFDLGLAMVEDAVAKGAPFRLRPSAILALHRAALLGLSPYAGNWRPAGVTIQGSGHEPIGAHLVPELIEEMCDYVNAHREERSAIHLAAYVMWRLNWIHPFTDGNGRTSRVVSYVVLCIMLESVLRGERTIPDQIVDNRGPYFKALESADAAWKDGNVDVRAMEELLEGMLAVQLHKMMEKAARKNFT